MEKIHVLDNGCGGPEHATAVRRGFVTQNEHSVATSAQVQSHNSAGYIDEFLADTVEVDNVNSAYSVDICCMKADDGTPLKNIISKLDHKRSIDKDLGTESDGGAASSACSEARGELQEKTKYFVKLIKPKEMQQSREYSTSESSKVMYDMSVDDNLQKKLFEEFANQFSGGCNEDVVDGPAKSLSESFSIEQAHQDCDRNTVAIVNYPASRNDPEVMKESRGLLRRCLLFDEARKDVSSKKISLHSANNISSTETSTSPAKVERSDFSKGNTSFVIRKKQMEIPFKQISCFSPHGGGNFTITASRPLGIGLHLNSVVKTEPLGETPTASMKISDNIPCIQEMKSKSTEIFHMVDSRKSCSVPSRAIEKVICSEEERHEIGASTACSTASSEFSEKIEHQDVLVPMGNCDSYHKRKFTSEYVEGSEEFNQISPRKRRKKQTGSVVNDNCRRCNCKKTKCLKLYCDCFAAGTYCTEHCSCQGCLNRPEFEDQVIEARQLIESRNPFAFAPKIVESITVNEFQANTMETDNWSTPSARHKKGCNCKKSMCLKKYCECYQANVGCSNNCRCEGCKNVYGAHQGYAFPNELPSSSVGEWSSLELLAANNESSHTEVVHPLDLSPLTPSLQYSDHGKGPLRSQLLARNVPSPDSDVVMISSSSKSRRPASGTDSNNVVPNRSIETPEPGSLGDFVDLSSSEMMDEFSPKCDSHSLINLCHLTLPSNHSSAASSSSSSSKAGDGSSTRIVISGPLRWRTSPITPATRLGETRICDDLKANSRLQDIMEDDTPEILKEVSTPIKLMNVNSPTRKRVSPPHRHMHELGSGSSLVGLKTGRKFILKAVPSLPPFTPCIQYRGSKSQNTSDLKDDRSNK